MNGGKLSAHRSLGNGERVFGVRQSRRHAELKAALLAVCALATGATVYLLIRDPRSLCLNSLVAIPTLPHYASDYVPQELISLSESLPTAAHAFGFSLLTGVALGLKRVHSVVACVSWVVIDTAFECSQALGRCSEGLLHAELKLTRFFCAYIAGGVFDWLDVGSIMLGAGTAYLWLQHLSNKAGGNSE
jgi:hypothetical protein